MLRSLTKKFFSLDSGQNSGDGDGNKRKDDYIIIVCQRNDIKKLEIQAVDPELAEMLGYSAEELQSRAFGGILPPHVNELIDDYLEYGGEGNDLSAVLSKVRDFSLLAKDKKNIPLSLRILPTTSLDSNPRFCLILRLASLQKVLDAGRDEIYRALRRNIISGDVGTLPQRDILLKDLAIVISYLQQGRSLASIAMVAIRDLGDIELKYGRPIAQKTLQEIALICKSSFREDDIIAQVSSNKIAVVLLEVDLQRGMTPLNRLRWKINAHEVEAAGRKIKVSAVIGCSEINAEDTPESILLRCERAISGDEDISGVTLLS